MGIFNPEKSPIEKPPSKFPIKGIAIGLGVLVGISHIGLLGYVLRPQDSIQQPPTINLPQGPYSSYKIKVGKEGYEIEYKADDPKVLTSERSSDLDKTKKGFLGGGSEKRTEYRRDEYTREGARNTGAGGAVADSEGKSAKEIECIVADAGARSQGATVGSALVTGLAVPALSSIPYVGFLAGGWALLLGNKAGSELGSQIANNFNDC
jgi:hypothetical protein